MEEERIFSDCCCVTEPLSQTRYRIDCFAALSRAIGTCTINSFSNTFISLTSLFSHWSSLSQLWGCVSEIRAQDLACIHIHDSVIQQHTWFDRKQRRAYLGGITRTLLGTKYKQPVWGKGARHWPYSLYTSSCFSWKPVSLQKINRVTVKQLSFASTAHALPS